MSCHSGPFMYSAEAVWSFFFQLHGSTLAEAMTTFLSCWVDSWVTGVMIKAKPKQTLFDLAGWCSLLLLLFLLLFLFSPI